MGFFSFGRKKKRCVKKRCVKKPPKSLLKMCKKLKIKVMIRRGKRRVYKSVKLLKKLCSKKCKKKHTKRFSFGDSSVFMNPANYGYNQPVNQVPGVLSQSSQVVTNDSNSSRPAGLGLPGEYTPTYGVYRPFFNEQVPTQVGPRDLGFMGQPDGSLYPVGGPFSGYRSSFGRRSRFGEGLIDCTKKSVTSGTTVTFPFFLTSDGVCRIRSDYVADPSHLKQYLVNYSTYSPSDELVELIKNNLDKISKSTQHWQTYYDLCSPEQKIKANSAPAFGKKRRRKSCSTKPSKALLREAKQRGIKVTRKVGGRRVYKTTAALKKQLR
jgi:hypothetical protein